MGLGASWEAMNSDPLIVGAWLCHGTSLSLFTQHLVGTYLCALALIHNEYPLP